MAYHDITGHYNAYFNANEKMKGVYVAMDKSHKDNYKQVLPLFTYSNPKEASGATADLDAIIKGLTLSVQIHKVSNWVDDDFVMMGRANYIKGNYDKALAFFKYTTTEYKNGVDYVKEMKKLGKNAKPTLKKKPVKKPQFEQVKDSKGYTSLNKIDERPSYSLLIHAPARSLALVWLAKTYSAQKKYTEASAVVQLMRSDDKFYTNLDKYVELTEAENQMNQKHYIDAIKPLEKFLTMTKKKSERVRPVFILAQIYELKGDKAKASDYYKQVLDEKPSYEMEFYAKIKRANLGKRSGSNDEIKKLLASMSHDGKYKDYLDQIYYLLGEIVLGENNRPEARNDFHRSIASSVKNPDQKALSYLALGRMDYDEEFYVSSKFYYDSTVRNMSKSDTTYDAIELRDKTLGKLVKQIDIITAEDSLQRIAKMSAADRKRFLQKLIDAKQKEANDKLSAKAANTDFIKQGLPGGSTTGGNTPSVDASSFYFYNTTARSNGYSEFIKKWGDRKLEDNWRRKDKSATMTEHIDEPDSAKAKLNAKDTVPQGSEMEKLLAGLPMTPEKMEKSNAKLIDAYYALGGVYKDDLQNYRKAIVAFEELNKRFPKSKLELESSYQLYLLYERTNNGTKSAYYKNLILVNYPNSTIAQYIKDPNYLAELKKKENSLSFYYESAYKDYSSGLYASAEQKCRDVDLQFKENKMRAKFDLLNAMALAKENRLSDYVESLNQIISKYPGTPEKDQAQALMKALNHSKLPQLDISKMPKDKTPVVSPDNDAADKVASIAKMDEAKKAKAKTDANATADNAPIKDNSPSTRKVKPYKPLTRAQRLDSLNKAKKAAKSATTSNTQQADTATHTNTTQTADTTNKSGVKPKTKPAPVAEANPAFDTDTLSKIYSKNDASSHYVIIYFLDPPAYKSSITGKLDNFNGGSISTSKLATKSSVLDKDNKLIMIKSFKNKDLAQDYLIWLSAKLSEIMPGIEPEQYFIGSISSQNYSTLMNTKKIYNYMRFYRLNYGSNGAAENTKAAAATESKDTTTKKEVEPVAKTATKDTTASKPIADTKPTPKPATAATGAKPTFDTDTVTQVYGKSDASPHYVIIYFLDPAAYSFSLVTKLDNFNSTSFPADRLNTHATILDNDNKLIHIKPFKNKEAAQAYTKALTDKLNEIAPNLKPEQYFIGPISQLNYATLINSKKINNYVHFSRSN
jgi:tetratricopeptide (TPR) repeat protein